MAPPLLSSDVRHYYNIRYLIYYRTYAILFTITINLLVPVNTMIEWVWTVTLSNPIPHFIWSIYNIGPNTSSDHRSSEQPSMLQHGAMAESRPPSPIMRNLLPAPDHWCSVQYFELDHKVRSLAQIPPIYLKFDCFKKSKTWGADDDRHKSTESFCYYFIF